MRHRLFAPLYIYGKDCVLVKLTFMLDKVYVNIRILGWVIVIILLKRRSFQVMDRNLGKSMIGEFMTSYINFSRKFKTSVEVKKEEEE